MGAWGMGPFENDPACDWVHELKGADDAVLEATFSATLTGDYFEVDEGSAAIAAAEVLAAMLGRPRAELPEEITAWVGGIPSAEAVSRARKLVPLALSALTAVVDSENSEVAELWAEADGADAAEWRGTVDDVRARLG